VTAPDPRLDEIQARVDHGDTSPWSEANALQDRRYLLAELRKAREALTDAGAKALDEAADAVAAQRDATNPDRTPDEAWSVIDHRDGRFFGKTVAVRLLRGRAKALRAAVAAAKGDGG
jgi:hypothetical protein